MLSQPFVLDALLAGSAIAIASGAVGWFAMLRGQVFAGDALGDVAFTGVLFAAAVGLDLKLGLLLATIAVALLLALLGGRAQADDVTIGVVLVWVLGLGVLFLDLFNTGSAGGEGALAARTLFGSLFELTGSEARLVVVIAAIVVLALAATARPLLFASLDPRVAALTGVPVRALGILFLVLVALDAAAATQAVGAVLLLGLVAAPGGAARQLTARPWHGVAISIALALASVWIGIAIAYELPRLPPGSAVVLVAAALYLASACAAALRSRARARRTRLGGSTAILAPETFP